MGLASRYRHAPAHGCIPISARNARRGNCFGPERRPWTLFIYPGGRNQPASESNRYGPIDATIDASSCSRGARRSMCLRYSGNRRASSISGSDTGHFGATAGYSGSEARCGGRRDATGCQPQGDLSAKIRNGAAVGQGAYRRRGGHGAQESRHRQGPFGAGIFGNFDDGGERSGGARKNPAANPAGGAGAIDRPGGLPLQPLCRRDLDAEPAEPHVSVLAGGQQPDRAHAEILQDLRA